MRRLVLISGDSMRPALGDGDLVVVRHARRVLAPGDVVLYREPRRGVLVAHRVVSCGASILVTAGDAVGRPDPCPVPIASVEGVVVARIPAAGRVLRLLRGKVSDVPTV